MGEPTFSYSVDNDRRFRDSIDRALKEVKDLKIPFNQIAFDWYKGNKVIFGLKSQGQYPDFTANQVRNGQRYSAYREFKIRKYGFDYALLKATSRLERSVTDPKSNETIFINKGTGIVLGSQVPYGIYHQSDKARKKIPLRKFIFIGPEAPRFATNEMKGRPERWLNIINNYVLKKIGARIK